VDATVLTVLGLLCLALAWFVLATHWELMALAEAHELNVADINAGRVLTMEQLDERYAQVPSFAAVAFDLTQWRYRSPFAA
jgi:hypothetical protein